MSERHVSRTCKELSKLNSKKTIHLKMSKKDLNRYITKELRCKDGKLAHEKNVQDH